MQSNYSHDSSAPLNERLTLVLLSHEQPVGLRRALRYYRSFACSVLVVDSSLERDADIAAASDIRYLHAPTASAEHFSSRLRQAVNQVTTPCMVMADVDSFLFPDALSASLSFLEAHGDYGVCQGYSLNYETHADRVDYFRRDRKGCEDYNDQSARARVTEFVRHCPSLVNAVTRTEVLRHWYASLPADFTPSLQDIGHSYGLMAGAKVRLLPIPYALHERHCRSMLHILQVAVELGYRDPRAKAEHERFAIALANAFNVVDSEEVRQQTRDNLAAIGECLNKRAGQGSEKIFESSWDAHLGEPVRRFEPTQFVELPFYNEAFFDVLSSLEFLQHAVPTGRLQLEELEAVMLKQKELLREHRNTSAEPLAERLLKAFELYAFNQQVVQQLAASSLADGSVGQHQKLEAWGQRLAATSLQDNAKLFDATRSGRLLNWLDARNPSAAQIEEISRYLKRHAGGPTFGILVLDLEADVLKLQATFDSVINSHCRAFKIMVFTTGDLPAETTLQNTLHFVKVNESNYVDKINQVVSQSVCDWMLLIEAGDELTSSGLYQAGLELLAAPQCRAVSMDEFQRQPNGTLRDVFRPGFNFDLLQSNPAMMARHWLVRRDLMVKAGGYSREFKQALEFDLLLRLIEQGGLEGLAHLDEPLLISQAPLAETNVDERKALLRHLSTRGYQADVSSLVPGTHKIDYRFTERPMVSIILHGVAGLEALQRCLLSVLQRTRYQRYEVLVAEDQEYAAPLSAWLEGQGQQANRVRFFTAQAGLASGALINVASQQAKGEYLVTLAADSEVVNVNWIESLLNQVLRPEVGVVGVKLIDREGSVTQAGLVLGFNDGVGSASVGKPKTSKGYLNRLVVEQNCSAVSFACLMISKQLFDAADGVDDQHFAEAFGDVDLCLRVGQAGYLTVWTPHVQVIQSGELAQSPAARHALNEKWSEALAHDRFYNKNLLASGSGFKLGPVSSIAWSSLTGQIKA